MALNKSNLDIGMVTIPAENEVSAGDGILVKEHDNTLFACLIDVAGHGKHAAELLDVVLYFINENYRLELTELVAQLHQKIRATRGAVGSFFKIDLNSLAVEYVGVGNTRAVIIGDKAKRFLNQQGIIGYVIPHLRVQEYALTKGETIIAYSDGITEFFELINTEIPKPNTANNIAKTIIELHGKRIDDASCLVVKGF